jgi:hypothetical protein
MAIGAAACVHRRCCPRASALLPACIGAAARVHHRRRSLHASLPQIMRCRRLMLLTPQELFAGPLFEQNGSEDF